MHPPPRGCGATPPPAPSPTGNTPDGAAFGLPAWMRSGGFAPAAPALPPPDTTNTPATLTSPTEVQHDFSWDVLQRRLMSALVAYDRRTADRIWDEALSRFSTEMVCTELLMPVLVAVGEGWHRGEVSVAAEHFSSRFVQSKLLILLNSAYDNPGAPLAVIGCAQGEMHEIGAIVLSLFLTWSGFRVVYLGQNVPNTTVVETLQQLRPQVFGLSATTIESAQNLTEAGHLVARLDPPRPQFIFGGAAFYMRPEMRSRIQGTFLEGDVRQIARQLAERHRRN